MKEIKNIILFMIAYTSTVVFAPWLSIYGYIVRKRKKEEKNYFLTAAIGFDQAMGSIFYGQEDWTISSWTHYLCKSQGRMCWFRKVIDGIFGKDHCEKSFEEELAKMKRESVTF